ncbi:polyprenyl synthetase family protein [Xiamenia xianingshaonis]|uniref:Polyprenyl synthetase family protein n=1 Tax=Xiamenia xianingshaonis TaxID=2682776 RepID=A0A9E6MQE9_9ACTN|nr:polyprenyl synthetase family protein [Xiamenia xianingshaonis]NHM13422.1 polyprenyl synthetase family protein [Xiamenia xianingshaonis]QTU84498.1 polyprenyl synthetase family protein [Xiamenia xianingshaonis]
METINDIIGDIPSAFTFDDFLSAYARRVGDLVNVYIPRGAHPDMDRYLYDPLKDFSKNGGKRHRPLICFAACKAVGGDMALATSAAAAIEHFHTAALIHDDIADEGELRRGKPCMHLTEGVGLAINVGDLALSTVNGTVVDDPALSDATKVRVISELIAMTRRTIEGQALDIGWARDGRYDVTPEDYLAMATHKTAHYSGATPLAVGAIIGGGTDEQVEALRTYGLATGLAFQIQDDLLNLIGMEESTKKDFRNDITEGKRTLVVVHALANGSEAQRARLVEILSARTKDAAQLSEAVDIMEAVGSIEYARGYAQQLTDDAKAQLVAALDPSPARDVLLSMADWFVTRLR